MANVVTFYLQSELIQDKWHHSWSFHLFSQMPEQNDTNPIVGKELVNFMKRTVFLEIRKLINQFPRQVKSMPAMDILSLPKHSF